MPVTQTIAFDAPSIAEIGSGAITSFLFNGTTLVATLSGIAESGTLRGRFTGTVVDIPAGTYRVVVKFNGFTVSEAEYLVVLLLTASTFTAAIDALAIGTPVFGHTYLEAIKRIEMCSGGGPLSGAGSGTEVVTSSDGTKTATFVVSDIAGNIGAVNFS
jgi:hypothetical protein